MLRRFYNAIQSLPTQFYLDLAAEDAVFISGSGRSGTSWLADLCNYRNDFRYIFEPFNPGDINSAQTITNWCPELTARCPAIDAALTGQIKSRWTDSSNRKLIARRRLIKGIRSNLMLEWITKHYPNTRLVQIYRNPLAVAASRKKLTESDTAGNWEWRPGIAELLQDPGIAGMLNDSDKRSLQVCIGAGVVMEAVADWCINNLLRLPKKNVHRVFYEDLVEQPKEVLLELFSFIDVTYSDSIERVIARPSHTTRSSQQGDASKDDITAATTSPSWASVLSDSELDAATEVLNNFGVNRLYNDAWQPIGGSKAC